MKTPGFPWPSDEQIAAQALAFDKAEFALAIRLLHVWWAWSGQCGPGGQDNPARKDPLYPMNQPGRCNEWPLKDAVEQLIKHHNYIAPTSLQNQSEPK